MKSKKKKKLRATLTEGDEKIRSEVRIMETWNQVSGSDRV